MHRGAGGNRRAFGYWRRCLGTRASLWSRGSLRLASAAEADSRSPRSIKYAKADACLAATGRNPRRRRRRGSGEDATEPSGTAAGSC